MKGMSMKRESEWMKGIIEIDYQHMKREKRLSFFFGFVAGAFIATFTILIVASYTMGG